MGLYGTNQGDDGYQGPQAVKSRVKCLRNYMTSPVPGFGSPERVRVLRHADGLPGYFVVRLPGDACAPRGRTIAMHESHIGSEVAS